VLKLFQGCLKPGIILDVDFPFEDGQKIGPHQLRQKRVFHEVNRFSFVLQQDRLVAGRRAGRPGNLATCPAHREYSMKLANRPSNAEKARCNLLSRKGELRKLAACKT
jgi:hypothetical protein